MNKSGYTKGRQLEIGAIEIVNHTLAHLPKDKQFIIEALHALQDQFGVLRPEYLQSLAEIYRISMAEVFEVASFYSHFIISEKPQEISRVCVSLPCMMAGAKDKIETLKKNGKTVVECSCLGLCNQAPVTHEGAFKAPIQAINPLNLVNYNKLKTGIFTSDQVLATLEQSGLRGLGGAGFPTHKKWQIVKSFKGDKVLVVNADEGEPGTFKDKFILENHLEQFLDGMMVASHMVEAKDIFIYIRDEYPLAREMLISAIKQLNLPHIHIRRGAGAYVCGEESALISSLEGKRGLPKLRPPYVAESGFMQRPTLVNNVETLYFVSEILNKGALNFAEKGINGAKGERHFSVSGRVKNAGVYLAPAGITARQLLEQAGGMSEGHNLKAYLPGGASGGILPESLADEPLDFGILQKHGAFVGSHAVIFLSDQDDLKQVAKNLLAFFAHESCGQCTPCREGAHKLAHLEQWNEGEIKDLAEVMMDASICGLGQAAPNPILSLYRHFRGEI